MNPKGRKALFASAVLSTVGIMVWPGCVTAPLPAKRESFISRKKSDFKWLKCAHPSRAETIYKLGDPDVYFNDLRVACYPINRVTHRKIWLLLAVIPVTVEETGRDVDVAFIEFDEQDRAQRFAVGSARDIRQIEKAARKWIEPKAK